MNHNLKSAWEILPWEAGQKWVVAVPILIHFEGHDLTIPKGFVFDRYSVVPDLPDCRPAAAHDYAYKTKRWDDGATITFQQANSMLLYLMQISDSWITRRCARLYYWGVVLFGKLAWESDGDFGKWDNLKLS